MSEGAGVGRLLLALALPACASATDTTGVLHGDVTVRADGGLHGQLVWEFFEGDAVTPEAHVCARLIAVRGEPDPESTCEDCEVAVILEVEDVEHDCAGSVGSDRSLARMDRLWIGPGSADRSAAFPDDRWSWSLGWKGALPEEEGVDEISQAGGMSGDEGASAELAFGVRPAVIAESVAIVSAAAAHLSRHLDVQLTQALRAPIAERPTFQTTADDEGLARVVAPPLHERLHRGRVQPGELERTPG